MTDVYQTRGPTRNEARTVGSSFAIERKSYTKDLDSELKVMRKSFSRPQEQFLPSNSNGFAYRPSYDTKSVEASGFAHQSKYTDKSVANSYVSP